MELLIGGSELTMLFQLLVAMLLGMLVGTERSIAGKTAGLRTFGLVSLGSCLFIVTAVSVVSTFAAIGGADIMRVLAGIVTGMGFLGAGAIMFRDSTLNGLTTAAALWVAAGIGVAVGFQLYVLAVTATVLTLLAFTLFWWLETRVKRFVEEAE